MKNPTKTLEKEIRALGGRKAPFRPELQNKLEWIMPDGKTVQVRPGLTKGAAIVILRDIQARYGNRSAVFVHAERVRGADIPQLDLARVRASEHAKERLHQMQAQARVEMQEVLMALRVPVRVLWSEPNESFLWVGERVAVAIVEREDEFLITTILWATPELWAEHPREVA